MGAILESTLDMGNWLVEVRRESAYIYGDTKVFRDVGFAIPIADVRQVVSAIDLIMSHRNYTEWLATERPTSENVWTATEVDGRLRLVGPSVYYGGHNGPWTAGAVELLYAQLPSLRATLEGVRS